MIFQLICWWVSYTFVLTSSSQTCEEDLSEVPYFVLNSCQFGCAILCGLVPVCWFCDRSDIESKSSRFRCLSPHRLIASNLGRYKAIYPLFTANLFLFLNLLSWRSGHPYAGLYRHLSCGNQSYRCHGRFCYHPLIYPLFTIYYCFHPHIYLFCHIL